MKHKLGFLYSVLCYLIGFSSLVALIVFLSNLIPQFSIDSNFSEGNLIVALLKNIGLIALFGLQHSIMARQSFKKWVTKFIPEHIERSTYVLTTGLLLFFILWQWTPIAGLVWSVSSSSIYFYVLYGLFFLGWTILLLSTFLINHFDLFGLRQAYLKMVGQPYTNLDFKVKSFYKLVRHPLYFGMVLGIWSTPTMTIAHLLIAILLTIYILIGIYYEERDLVNTFGVDYKAYQNAVPKLIPIPKLFKKKPVTVVNPNTQPIN